VIIRAPHRAETVPCATQENAGILKLGALYALGDNTLDTLAADWQRDSRFVTRALETIKVIVKPKEETLRHRDRDSSFLERGVSFFKVASRSKSSMRMISKDPMSVSRRRTS
jgi:hypothetical protein